MMLKDQIAAFFGGDDSKLIYHMKEYDVSKKMLEDSLKALKSWIKRQPHLKGIHLDDRFTIGQLCFNGYSVEKTKAKLDNLFAAKSLTPEFFTRRDPCDVEVIRSMETVQWVLMPRTFNGNRVCVVRFTGDFLNTYDPVTSFKIPFMGMELRLMHETTFSDQYVIDCENIKLSHVIKITPSVLKKAFHVLQNCYSSRIKAIHAVNVPGYALGFIGILKAALRRKIADRIRIHDSLAELHRHVDVECLPKELGGTAEQCSVYAGLLMNILQSNEWRQRMIKSEYEKSNEKLRPECMRGNFAECLGIEGSFRKLEID